MRLTGKRLELTLNLIKRMKDDTETSVSIEVAMSLVIPLKPCSRRMNNCRSLLKPKQTDLR